MTDSGTGPLPDHVRVNGSIPERFLRTDLVAGDVGRPEYSDEERRRVARRVQAGANRLRPGEAPGAQDDAGLRALFDEVLGYRDRLVETDGEDVGDLGILPAGRALVAQPSNGGAIATEQPAIGLVLRAPWRTDLDRKQPAARFNVSWTDAFERVLARRGLGWGIVTSGDALRLVRRGTEARASYLEFDVAAIAEDLDAADPTSRRSAQTTFDLLVLLGRARAFEPRERKKGEALSDHAWIATLADDDERQVGKDLAEQVYPALEWIVRGLLEHPANGLGSLRSEQELREVERQALTLLYRLLFLFMADARELTPSHPIYQRGYAARTIAREAIRGWERLSEAERAARATEVATWRTLQATFRIARHGAVLPEGAELAALGGGLFAAEASPLLESAVIGEHHLVEALQRLTRRQVRSRGGTRGKWLPIEYARLDIERLGSVYEGLLDFEPRIAGTEMVEVRVKSETSVVVPGHDLARVLDGLDRATKRKPPAASEESEEEDEEPEDESDPEKPDADELPIAAETEAPWGGDRRALRRIPAGRFYLAPSSARRKGSGSYYTPVALTTYLVRETLGPLVRGKSPEEILRLRVLDPAMGSGAFLVAACRFLGDAYTRATIDAGRLTDEEVTEEVRALHRRLVAESCLCGVDLNPMAVELARLSLWLETLARDRPLTFLDHRLRPGNSLIGARLRDLDGIPDEAFEMLPRSATKAQKARARDLKKRNAKDQKALRSSQVVMPGFGLEAELAAPVDLVRRELGALSGPSDTVEEVRAKAERYRRMREDDHSFKRLKQTLDLWCAAWFWPPDASVDRPTSTAFRRLAHRIWGRAEGASAEDDAALTLASEVAERRRFLHYELEFPDAAGALGSDPARVASFDAVIGNPPWDKIEAHPKDFFPNYDPLFRTYDPAQARAAEEYLTVTTEIDTSWKRLMDEADLLSAWTRTAPGYLNQVGGRAPNVYRPFAERAIRLLRTGGRLGFVLPANLCAEDAGVGLRKLWLTENRWVLARVFENREKIFPIHRSFKFGAFVVEAGGATEEVDAAFMLHRFDQIEDPGEARLRLTMDFIQSFSAKSLALLEFRRGRDVEIARRLWAAAPALGEEVEGRWRLKFGYDLNGTHQRSLMNTAGHGYPCLENKMFWQFDHRLREPTRWSAPEIVRPFLAERELKRWRAACRDLLGVDPDDDAAQDLPLQCDGYRIAYRDIAPNTNQRTLIAAVIPPGWLTTEAGPGAFGFEYFRDAARVVARPALKAAEWLVVSALLNGLTADFAMRLLNTGTHVKIHHLARLPVPRLTGGESVFDALVGPAGRLTCTTFDYGDLWQSAMGTPWTPDVAAHDETERRLLRAEIDAIVARIYGLDRDDLEYILSTFEALRNTEVREQGEFLTRRLVLSAFDRLRPDFTFESE